MKLLRAIGAVGLVIIALPVALFAGLFSKGRKCTPEELVSDLRALADGTEGEMTWGTLECVPIIDPRLEAIRREAIKVNLPLQTEDRAKLSRLATSAAALNTVN